MIIKTIELVEQSLFQIKSILMNDAQIRKLLYLQNPNALTSEINVTAAQVNDLISIVPYVDEIEGIENSSQSNFIVIYAPIIELSNDIQHMVTIGIDMFVYKDYFLLDGSKMRLTQLLNRVLHLLENKKLAFSEKFSISDVRLSNIEKGKTIGYLTNWTVANGTDSQY